MATVTVLLEGYYFRDQDAREHAGATVTLVRDGGIVMVVDPGTLKSQKILIEALAKEGLKVDDVNVVGITHSHLDHYQNMGVFKKARILEYFGLWNGDILETWDEHFSENIQIVKTPGHDETSITFFVTTKAGVVAICGDVFWKENYPKIDLYATNLDKLNHSRKLVLAMARWIVPGHAGIYEVKKGDVALKGLNHKKLKAAPLGNCKKCHRPFLKSRDKCFCQEWLCWRCCECEYDCNVCNCSHHV